MPWANLDDRFPTHPKVVRLSDAAFRLHVAGICYCANHLTDGKLDPEVVPLLTPRYRAKAVEELLDREMWVRQNGHYEIHDYLEWNRSKEQVDSDRERRSRAGRKAANERWRKP